jgi:hypothetical protein
MARCHDWCFYCRANTISARVSGEAVQAGLSQRQDNATHLQQYRDAQ